MKMKFRHLFSSAGLVALLSIALLGTSTAAFADPNGSPREPEGSWLYMVTIPGFGSFQGVETYSAGGGYSEADQLSFSPGAVASAGHGAWKSHGGAWKLSSDLCQSHFRRIQHGSADWNFESPANRDDRQDGKFVQWLWRFQLLRYTR